MQWKHIRPSKSQREAHHLRLGRQGRQRPEDEPLPEIVWNAIVHYPSWMADDPQRRPARQPSLQPDDYIFRAVSCTARALSDRIPDPTRISGKSALRILRTVLAQRQHRRLETVRAQIDPRHIVALRMRRRANDKVRCSGRAHHSLETTALHRRCLKQKSWD